MSMVHVNGYPLGIIIRCQNSFEENETATLLIPEQTFLLNYICSTLHALVVSLSP